MWDKGKPPLHYSGGVMGPPFWSWCQGGVSISGWMQPAVCWRDLWWNKQLWQRLNPEERLTDVCRKVHGRCTLMDKCSADKDRETKNLWWNDLPTASRPTDEATRWWLGFHAKEWFFQNLSRTFGMTLFKFWVYSCFRGHWTKQKHLYKSVIGITCQRNVTKRDFFCV